MPASLLKGKKPTQSSSASAIQASSWSWSASVSPGYPTMNDERKAAVGSAARIGPDPLEEAVALAPAAHALQQGPGHVLEGEVEVGHAGRQYGLHQRVVEGGRIEVEEPGPPDPLGHRAPPGRRWGGCPRWRGPSIRGSTRPLDRSSAKDERSWATRTTSASVPVRPRPAGPPRPGSTRPTASAACRGTTGWRRSRSSGRTLRPPSRTTTEPWRGAVGRFNRSNEGTRGRRRACVPSVTGVRSGPVSVAGAATRRTGATRSTSGRASASSSP